jgi:hypothetical protein
MPVGRPRSRWEDIKIDLRGIGWGGIELIRLVQDKDQWWALSGSVEFQEILE